MNDSPPRKLLIIGYVWPEPTSSAAGQRMMQLIGCFQQDRWEITFATTASKSKRSVDFSSINVQTHTLKINHSSADHFLSGLNPDVVLFDSFITEEQFGWRVAEQCPHALRILDTEDLHCLRLARKKALDEGRKFSLRNLLQDETAKREIAGIYRCDLSLIISEFEYQLLRDLFSIDEHLLYYLPFLFEPIDENKIAAWPKFQNRKHFVMIGNFRHAPNWDAVQYLKQSIWPHIHEQLPNEEMHIYGAYPSKKAKLLHQPETGFFIKGQIDDAKKVVRQARVLLAPLRFGAGLKGKLTEAMQCGTPSVTTPIGAEGLKGEMKWCGFVTQSPQELAASAIKLYSQKAIWEKAQRQGAKIINRRFQKNKFEPALMSQIREICRNLKNHRRQNFIGSMLMHHTAAGTKYMSKWIEAKNANGKRQT